MPKILVVDDEETIVKIIEQSLKGEGMTVVTADDGEQALTIFKSEPPDLVILDLMLPKIDGFAVCARIREHSHVPVIILSAKGDLVDKSVGFNLGADDYLTKPFSPQELLMRVKAVLRRSAYNTGDDDEIKLGEIRINKSERRVWATGKEVKLTPKEFDILHCLAREPGRVFSREQLVSQVWGDPYIDEANNIAVYIRKLRQKLEIDCAHPRIIETVWGVGYRMAHG